MSTKRIIATATAAIFAMAAITACAFVVYKKCAEEKEAEDLCVDDSVTE